MKTYQPSPDILKKYAQVIVDFALGKGRGMKKGETVYLHGYESGKPLYAAIARRITQQGGNIIHNYHIDDPEYPVSYDFLTNASKKQLAYIPENLLKGRIQDVDHFIYIHSLADPNALKGVDPKRIMLHQQAQKMWADLRRKKEHEGKFSWNICSYGTEAMANEAGITQRQYWNQIIKACFLNDPDPIAQWRKVLAYNKRIVQKLNKMNINKIHMIGEDVDLWIELPEQALWRSTDGANIPSFEVFTSPRWQGTRGWIRFNQPLYRYGQKIDNIFLRFNKGRVIEAQADTNQVLLKEMIATKNADKLGEFSLTDGTVSSITRYMADTLFDENRGGRYGNTHVALGSSFHDCYGGDRSTLHDDESWQKLGYNTSAVHTDIVSTKDRTVYAYTKDGKEKVIYQDGRFCI